LIELAWGQAAPQTAARLQAHLQRCDCCRAWVEAAAPSSPVVASTGLSSVVLSGFFTRLLAGRTQEALQILRPYLPDVLEAVGLDPALAERLWQFLLQRIENDPHGPAALLPDWLRDFAREALRCDALPRHPGPDEWEPVLTRCALRNVLTSSEEPHEVRRFLQTALDHGVDSAGGLDLFRLSTGSGSVAVSAVECRRLIRKVRR